MPIIRHRAPLQCLVAVRGHPFDRTAFGDMFDAMDGVAATMVDQPAAARLMSPEGMAGFDALVLYDMPGLDFEAPTGAPLFLDPPEALVRGFEALLKDGKGVLALHHALAGWPSWQAYGEWLGGRFFYHPGHFAGRDWPDSGYAHDVAHDVHVLADHPVTDGCPRQFPLVDELYLCPMAPPPDATPLIGSSASFTAGHFHSAELAVAGRMNCRDGWDHPPGSAILGWARTVERSRLVYLQPGDGPATYADPNYRRLVENALRWVAAGPAVS